MTTTLLSPVTDAETGQIGHPFGASWEGNPLLLPVGVQPNGCPRIYYVTHQRIFNIREHCPLCRESETK